MSEDEIQTLLSEVSRQQKELKDEFHKKKRDGWDKFSVLSSLISGILIAAIGWYFTHSYNQQQTRLATEQSTRDTNLKDHQMKLAEIDTVSKFMPYLAGSDEKQKEAAILAINQLANTELASKIAATFGGQGAVQAMTKVAENSKHADPNTARTSLSATTSSLATIAATSNPEIRKAAVEALQTVNDNPLKLKGIRGENINVTVTAEGTTPMIFYSLDGHSLPGGTSISFTLDKAEHMSSILVMGFIFSQASGGVYTIKVTGSNGLVSSYVVRQHQGEDMTTVVYTFEIQ